jgi:type II secretory pathway component PulF
MTQPPIPSIPPPIPPHPPQPLDYRGDRVAMDPGANAQRRGNAIFSIVRFVAAMVVMLIILGIFLTVVPRLERVYADFGTRLPLITQLVLDISRFLQTPLGWVVAAVITCIIAVVVAVLPIPRRWLRLLVIFIMALVIITLALAVLLPMINLMDNSSAGKK